jgi:hypothetical protein
LTVHLVGGTIWRGRVARVLEVAVAVLLELLHAASGSLVLPWDLGARLVADGGQLDGATRLLLVARSGGGGVRGSLGVGGASGSTSTVIVSLALVLLLLLAGLPLLADFLELCFRGKQLARLRLHKSVPPVRFRFDPWLASLGLDEVIPSLDRRH